MKTTPANRVVESTVNSLIESKPYSEKGLRQLAIDKTKKEYSAKEVKEKANTVQEVKCVKHVNVIVLLA